MHMASEVQFAFIYYTIYMFVLHPRIEELSSVWWDGTRWVKDDTRAKQDPSWGTTDVFNLSRFSVLAYWMREAEWLPGAVMTHDNDFVREMANGIADVCGKCLASRKSMVTLFVDVGFCFSMWPVPSATGNPGNPLCKTRSVLCLKCLRQYRILHQFAGLETVGMFETSSLMMMQGCGWMKKPVSCHRLPRVYGCCICCLHPSVVPFYSLRQGWL